MVWMLQKMMKFAMVTEVLDEWLSSWYNETHVSQKVMIEAKTQGDGEIQENERVPCCHKRIHEKGPRRKNISITCVITNKGTEEHPIAKARLVAREFNTGDKRGESFAGTPGLMAMRTVISRAMTRCENGAKRSTMLA